MATALDYSAGRPAAATVLADGHAGVVRYVGTPGRAKNITKAEYLDMTSRGVGVALVYENGSGDSGGGYSAGVTAARIARADANSVGFPASRPIYFAVDSDQVTAGQFAAAMSYLDGAASVSGIERVGVYGEYDVVERAVGPHARYGWQTVAWSHGLKSAKAALYQRLGQIYVGGIQVDVNDILTADWGQHNYGGDDMQLSDTVDLYGNEQDASVNNVLAGTFANVKDALAEIRAARTTIGQLVTLVSAQHDVDETALATALAPTVTAAIAAKDFGGLPEETAQAVRDMLHEITGR